jgi:hypothetical protein
MPYEQLIDKVRALLTEAADILGGMALLGDLSTADETYISAIHMDLRSAIDDLEEFKNGTHNLPDDDDEWEPPGDDEDKDPFSRGSLDY